MSSFPLDARFLDALQLAHQWHVGQYRKGTATPYVSHLLGVASIALEFGATETEAIAALLHDALEDGPEWTGKDAVTLEQEIEGKFGSEVARLVRASTDAMPKAGEQKAPWAGRKTEYLEKLKAQQDASSLLVSASDKLHNARAILTDVLTAGDSTGAREAFFDRFNAGREGTLQYYRLLVRAYRHAPGAQGHARLQALFSELHRTVTAVESTCGVHEDEVADYVPLRAVNRRHFQTTSQSV